MTPDRVGKAGRADTTDALDLALQQGQEVKAKVETCADDLASTNEVLAEGIADGRTLLSAQETLQANTNVESQVQECADDLHEVTETLEQGIDHLAQTEIALTESRELLADTQAALAISQEEESDARRRALHDSMTGLPNRYLFDDRLSNAISIARRHDCMPWATRSSRRWQGVCRYARAMRIRCAAMAAMSSSTCWWIRKERQTSNKSSAWFPPVSPSPLRSAAGSLSSRPAWGLRCTPPMALAATN